MKKQNGITLIALVISIIVMLILAGVSINATVGDNGIISKAQNATYSQSCAVLEEFLKQYYISNFDLLPQDASNKAEVIQKATNWIWNPSKHGYGNLGYVVTSEGKACYFIDKDELLKSNSELQLQGGDAGEKTYADYSMMNDVYGVTSDLKVYYCASGNDSILGITNDDLDIDNPLREVFTAGSPLATLINNGDTSKNVTAEDIKGIKELTIDGSNNVSLKELYNLTSLQKLTLTNYTESLDGLQDAVLLNEIMLKNCTISDYSAIGKLEDKLTKLYLYNSTDEEIAKLCDSSVGIANYDLPNLQYLGIFGFEDLEFSGFFQTTNNIDQNNSEVTNLESLSNLSSVTKNAVNYLFINNNKITSVNFLQGFTNLKFVRMENNQITSLAGISNLNKLMYLHANNNQLGLNVDTATINEKTDALAECVNLSSLIYVRLSNNPNIKWINYLSNLTELKYVYLNNCTGIVMEDMKSMLNIAEKCKENFEVNSKYSLVLLSSATTVLDLSNQTVDEASFLSISDKTKIYALNLKNIILVDENGNQLSAEQTNTDINAVLEKLVNMKYLQLYGITNLTTIDFASNMKSLMELDLRNTSVTDLTNLNNITTIATLVINNSDIDITTIQPTISRCYLMYSAFWLKNSGAASGSGYKGFLCYNWSLVKQLEKCTEITSLIMFYHDEQFTWKFSGGTTTNRPSIDLSNCTKLTNFYACRFFVDMKMPSSIIFATCKYQIGAIADFSECTNLREFEYQGLNVTTITNGYTDIQTLEYCLSTLSSKTSLKELNIRTICTENLECLKYVKDCDIQKLLIGGDSWSHITILKSISGIEYLTNLQYLELRYCDTLTNIDPISSITTLTEVYLHHNSNLSSIAGLKNNANLTTMTLNDNSISSLNGIEEAKLLTYINLNNNSLSDRYSYVDDTGTTITKSTIDVLANLAKTNSSLKTILLSGNNGIIDYSSLTSIGWDKSTGKIN